ncbi:DUF6069 family protein [Streptomyces sp. AK010]|uniref:DUF6069 family protein n=1 Tax=Streptomyces sp. AK010 TaxID=2723074 RepID=UPI001622AB63|nr:DUF6069 family protein [Streptomyces sp. AK010]MBB6417925.1 hypothetical protein [Streptomyces sp. AK010]
MRGTDLGEPGGLQPGPHVVQSALPRTTAVAGTVLAKSFLPLLGDGMDGGTRTSLALMRLAVAAVLIPGLGGTFPEAGAGAARE